jgi:hypothetical protein
MMQAKPRICRLNGFLFDVDIICINQQDTDEKAKQVQLMGQIYETAMGVIVWLGPEDSRDCRAFEFVRAPMARKPNY